MSKTCPQCRSERDYADTSRVNGINDFLEAVAKLFSADDSLYSIVFPHVEVSASWLRHKAQLQPNPHSTYVSRQTFFFIIMQWRR